MMDIPAIDISTERYHSMVVCGIEGSGKTYQGEVTSLFFHLTEHWLPVVINPAGEEGVWRIIPEKDGGSYVPVVLVVPEYAHCEVPPEFRNRLKIVSTKDENWFFNACDTALGMKHRAMVVLGSWLFDVDHHFEVVAQILREEIKAYSDEKDQDFFIDICEADDLAPAGMKEYDGATETKRALKTFSRKKRHYRSSYLIENQDPDFFPQVKKKITRWYLKPSPPSLFKLDAQGLPGCIRACLADLNDLHETFKGTEEYPQIMKSRPKLEFMKPWEFYTVLPHAHSIEQQYWKESLPRLPWHHKTPGDSLRRQYGVVLYQDRNKLKAFLAKQGKSDKWIKNYATLCNNLVSEMGVTFSTLSRLTEKDKGFVSALKNEYPDFFSV